MVSINNYRIEEKVISENAEIKLEIQQNTMIRSGTMFGEPESIKNKYIFGRYLPQQIDIIRKLIDDTFLIKMEYPINLKALGAKGDHHSHYWNSIQVSNQKLVEFHSEENYEKIVSNASGKIFIPPELIKNQAFTKTKSIVFGFVNPSNPKKHSFFKLKIIKPNLSKNFNIKSNQAIHFKILNEIIPTLEYKKAFEINDFRNGQYVIKKKYTHILLMPIKVKKQGLIKKMYKVAIWNDQGSKNISRDFAINDLKISGLITDSAQKQMGAKFQTVKSHDTINGHQVNGLISFSGVSYYDYNKQNTALKSDRLKASDGYVLPYSFSGNFHPCLTLGLNKLYAKINITSSEDLAKPYLDFNNGTIKMQINKVANDFKEDFKMKINAKDFDEILKNNFDYNYLVRNYLSYS